MMRSSAARTLSRYVKDLPRLAHPTSATVGSGFRGSVCPSCLKVTRGEWTQQPLGARPYSAVINSENIMSSTYPDEKIPEVNFANYIFDSMRPYKDRAAMVDHLSGRSYTYEQIEILSRKLGSALSRQGYRKGDVIAVYSVNVPEYCMVILSAALCGIVITPANPAYNAGELARQLEMSKVKAVFTIGPLVPTLKDAINSSEELHKAVKDIFVFGEAEGCRPVSDLFKDDGSALPKDIKIDPKEDVMVLPFSSGTMGLPKGVMLTHYNCIANLRQSRRLLKVEKGVDRLIGMLPFYHIYGMLPIQFGSLQDGATMYTVPKFTPDMFLDCLAKNKVTILHVVPPVILFLAKHPMVAKYDLSNLRHAVSGAAPLGESLTKECEKRLNVPLYQGYGLTEMSPVINLDTNPHAPGTIGLVLPNTKVKMQCPETGATLPLGELGEYCVKGPQMMKGYLNNPEATADMIDKDGWLHTGDLGYLREDGRVVIEDRLKELIKYKGFQVPPAELEAFLLTHPSIQDVGVIGVPEEGVGELPRAYIVKKPDASVSKEDISKFVEDNMAGYKNLRGGVVFIDEIPKSASGKILRRVLRDTIAK